MNILIIGAVPRSLINFRGDLIREIVSAGHQITGAANGASTDIVAQFADMGAEQIRALGKVEHVLYDLKYILPADASDLRL